MRAVSGKRLPLAIGGAVFGVLMAFSGGYGYHRDELYFVEAGRHLAFGYPDQGPLTPLIARVMTEIAPDSLVALRLPSALMAAATVVLAGLIAAELGGRRRAQVVAAACTAAAAVVLFVGHLLTTSSFDLLAWTAVTYLAVRAIRTGDDRLWIAAGAVLGLGLLNKPLIAFLAVGLLAGVLIAGPRELLRKPSVWAGAGIALALWTPWIVWQAGHGWPQLDVAESIQGGGSTSSEPRWAFLPFQLLLVSPLLAPVWIAGLVRLFRGTGLRPYRFLAWTWVVLAAVFIVTGGKPYYLAGLFPVLLAAGGLAVDGWLERGRRGARTALVAAAVAVSALVGAVIALPVLPRDQVDPVLALNEDVGETIGWPDLAETVAAAAVKLPSEQRIVVVTEDYGQAGALDRYGPDVDAPGAFSGHNGYHEWGPPPDRLGGPFIAVGFGPGRLPRAFDGCEVDARVRNDAGVDNEESGTPVWICTGLRGEATWSEVWPSLRRLG